MRFFAPATRLEAIKLFLAIAACKDFKISQLDVKSAFLNGEVDELVYVKQSPGFTDPNYLDHVYHLRNALCGLHQAPRACMIHCQSIF